MIKINLLPKKPTRWQRMKARINPRKIILSLPFIALGIMVFVTPIALLKKEYIFKNEVSDIICYSSGVVMFEGKGTHVDKRRTGRLKFKDVETGQWRTLYADCMVTK